MIGRKKVVTDQVMPLLKFQLVELKLSLIDVKLFFFNLDLVIKISSESSR